RDRTSNGEVVSASLKCLGGLHGEIEVEPPNLRTQRISFYRTQVVRHHDLGTEGSGDLPALTTGFPGIPSERPAVEGLSHRHREAPLTHKGGHEGVVAHVAASGAHRSRVAREPNIFAAGTRTRRAIIAGARARTPCARTPCARPSR